MDKSNKRMAGVYGVLLLAWWSGWLALDAWRIEHVLTNADKWEGFRRDILLCAGSAMMSFLALMMHDRKKTAVLGLVITLAVMLLIAIAIVCGSSFIHWQINTALFLTVSQWFGLVPLALVPLVIFALARIDQD
jgi:hypothetical protein